VHDDDGSDSGGDSGDESGSGDECGDVGEPVKVSSPTLKTIVDLSDTAKMIAMGFRDMSLCVNLDDDQSSRAVSKINTTLLCPSGVLQSLMEVELARLKTSWVDVSRRGLNIGVGYKTLNETIFRPHERELSMIDPKRSKLNKFARSLGKRKQIDVHRSDFMALSCYHTNMIDEIGKLVDAAGVPHLKRDLKMWVKRADEAWGKVRSAISDAVGVQGAAKADEAARKRRVADDAKDGADKWGRVEDEMERPDLAPLYNVPVIGNTFA
jgi:hypothetical protein